MTASLLHALRCAKDTVRVRRLAASTLILCAALFGGGSAARGDVTYTTVRNPTPVSFFRDRLVWSTFDQARHGYALMTHQGGVTSTVPVQTRGVPFDADLGPDENGDTVLVYSRCGQEPRFSAEGHAPPVWSSGRGCNIFQFNFATGRETRLASANTARSSEFLPSIWETRIAFARVYERRRGRAGDRAYLYARPLLGTGRSNRLRAGRRSSGRICIAPQEGAEPVCGVSVEAGPSALDLRGRRVAFAWETRGRCAGTTTGVWLEGQTVLWTATDAGRTFYLLSLFSFPPACTGVPSPPALRPPPICVLNELMP